MPAPPFAMVRSLIADDTHGHVGVIPLAAPEGPRFITTLACERVSYASGHGVCLTLGADGMRTTYTAEIFDSSFEVRGRVPLTGVPSRVRVSPDGRRAGITVFEEGHSYAEQGLLHPDHAHRHAGSRHHRRSRVVCRHARRSVASAKSTSTSGA